MKVPSVDELKERITGNQFLDWMEFMEWDELHSFRRIDHYLAQIAAEIRRANVKHPEKVDNKDLLLEFVREERKKLTPVDEKRKIAESKSVWFAITGMKNKKVLTQTPPKKRKNHGRRSRSR